jgi:pyrroline-5-carboxylate reductase
MTLAEHIFSAMGKVVRVEEQQIDAVTGLSGSGPAYLYYIAEALEQAGVEVGLSAEEARLLTVQTFVGAAKMLSSSGKNAKTLREEVTSPNGTTMAGLEQLAQGDVATLIGKAVKAAKRRSEEMGEELEKN